MKHRKKRGRPKKQSTTGCTATRNPVAKHARAFNKAAVHTDRKREAKKNGYEQT